MEKHDSLKGSYLQLNDFKGQLLLFDRALSKLHEDKVGKAELQEREEKFNPNHYYALFNDMKKLVDEQSLAVENKVNQF